MFTTARSRTLRSAAASLLLLFSSSLMAAQSLDRSVLDDPSRPDGDKAQDDGRKPIELYEWLGIEPGMTVADLWPGGGYNAHLLSRLVGDSGRVVTVWQFFARRDLFGGQLYLIDGFREHAASAELSNVVVAEDFPEVADNSIEVVLAVRNYHDVEWTFDMYKRTETVASIYRITEPGGIVGIVEVATPAEGWDNAAHRLNEQVVIDDFTAGGFEFVERSELLANPDDDHSQEGFPNRHLTDRYALKFRKPAR